jgi:hypothetical protein
LAHGARARELAPVATTGDLRTRRERAIWRTPRRPGGRTPRRAGKPVVATEQSDRQIFCVGLPAFTQPSIPSGMTATFV